MIGKTETAKALAAQLFDSEKMIIRLDMGEYTEAAQRSTTHRSATRVCGIRERWTADRGGSASVNRTPWFYLMQIEVRKHNKRGFTAIMPNASSVRSRLTLLCCASRLCVYSVCALR